MDDNLIYALAVEQARMILTINVKDFRPLLTPDAPGIIGIPETWSAKRLDTKLTAVLMKYEPNFFRGHFHALSVIEEDQ